MLIVASWNVNSVRARLDSISNWINIRNPDIIFLQEIKCNNESFPYDFFSNLNYESYVVGQKGRNGVATLIKKKLKKNENKNHGEELNIDGQSRFSNLFISEKKIHFCNIYVPNGNPIDDNMKFNFKINFLEKLKLYLSKLIENEEMVLIGGDFNVIENVNDAKNFSSWESDALGNIRIRKLFRKVLSVGMINVCRFFFKPGEFFSFFDYQKMSWERNDGILIDHFLISPNLSDKIVGFGSDLQVRGWEKPSDHVPIWVKLNI